MRGCGARRDPDFMDALVPMASQPTAMAARNWLLRRIMLTRSATIPTMLIGNYTAQPRMLNYAIAAYGLASAGGTFAYQKAAPTRGRRDALVDARLKAPRHRPMPTISSMRGAPRTTTTLRPTSTRSRHATLVVNAADDERNPPETGLTEAAVKRIKNAALLLIPASADTTGHLTTGNAKWYANEVGELLAKTPARGM